MRKSIFILSLLTICFSANAFGQSSASASQTIQLQLNPIIEIDASTAIVNVGKSVNNTPQFKVRSNKDFIISVNAQSNSPKANVTQEADILSFSLVNTDNNSSYKLTSNSQDILSGKHGKDNTFAVNYKTKQSKNNNNYSMDVVYTATQP